MAKSRSEFEETAEALHRWLDTLDLDDTGEVDIDHWDEALGDLNMLAWAGASDPVVHPAVTRARHNGCAWAPIAVALGIPRQRARSHFSRPTE